MMERAPVAVIGGGWAGCAAANQRQGIRLRRAQRHDRQRCARKHATGADLAMDTHQNRHRLLVGAEQKMLAVVEREPGTQHAARASSQQGRSLEQVDADAGLRQRHRGGASGPAAADDGHGSALRHAERQVRHASQSLRSGVSDVRRSRTL